MADEYKQAKEAFVSGMTGSSITHINLVSLVALASVSLYAAIRTRIPPTRSIGFLASWAILVFPMLLAMTWAANQPLYLIILLLLPTVLILQIRRAESGTPLPSSQPSSPSLQTNFAPQKVTAKFPPLPALTTYRAHMMLMTVLAILAVDFPVFPRALAKCETFGVSLMDLGVGSFVFSQGLISAIPLVNDPLYIKAPFIPKLLRVTWKSLPIIVLGVVRVLLVKGTEYPEHETEYGTHWNFFITLALLPVIQVMLHPVLQRLPISMVGVLVGLSQQLALSHFALKEYVLSAPRTSLISANKEGIISLPGYLAIHLLGLSAGTLILPPTQSFFMRRQKALFSKKDKKRRDSNAASSSSAASVNKFDLSAPRQLGKTATELCAYSIIWWSLLGLTRLVGLDGRWGEKGGVSRRMVNLPYILWVAAFNTSFLLSYLVVLDMWIFANSGRTRAREKAKHYQTAAVGKKAAEASAAFLGVQNSMSGPGGGGGGEATRLGSGNPPRLLEVINRHGLMVFLLANLLTGLVNLTVSTMYVSDGWAMVLLSGYSVVLCGLAWFGDEFMGRRK